MGMGGVFNKDANIQGPFWGHFCPMLPVAAAGVL